MAAKALLVAPARERGLKFGGVAFVTVIYGRSREGAWIEIDAALNSIINVICRSREGAWIEICWEGNRADELLVAPARERGLKYR